MTASSTQAPRKVSARRISSAVKLETEPPAPGTGLLPRMASKSLAWLAIHVLRWPWGSLAKAERKSRALARLRIVAAAWAILSSSSAISREVASLAVSELGQDVVLLLSDGEIFQIEFDVVGGRVFVLGFVCSHPVLDHDGLGWVEVSLMTSGMW